MNRVDKEQQSLIYPNKFKVQVQDLLKNLNVKWTENFGNDRGFFPSGGKLNNLIVTQ